MPDATTKDRAKLTADLDNAADQIAARRHEVDTFEADLEYNVRDLEFRGNQLLRTFDPNAQHHRLKTSPPAAKLEAK